LDPRTTTTLFFVGAFPVPSMRVPPIIALGSSFKALASRSANPSSSISKRFSFDLELEFRLVSRLSHILVSSASGQNFSGFNKR
jgi:hypothetical protein